jgi:hypothetical protein
MEIRLLGWEEGVILPFGGLLVRLWQLLKLVKIVSLLQ